MFFKIILASLTFALAAAESLEKCPDFHATTNLNLEKFAEGKWYLLAESELSKRNCTTFETRLTPKKIIRRIYESKRNEIFNIFSSDHPFEVDVEKGLFTLPNTRFNDEPQKYFVNTDYDHYSLNYFCKVYTDGSIEEVASLNVRKDDLSNRDSSLENAKKLLLNAGSKLKDLHFANQENCTL